MIDEALRRQLSRPLTRRAVLRGGAYAGVSAFLAACGGGLGTPTPTTGTSPTASGESPTAEAPPASPGGTLVVANWPAYIDLTGTAAEEEEYSPGSSPTLEAFQEEFGIEVDYQEKIEDNSEFMATIEPALVAGVPTGWDIIVVTDWLAAKIIERGWAEKLDTRNVQTAASNLREPLRGQAWDPNEDYHYPWQSGMTIVAYNSASFADNGIAELKKIADLWNVPAERVAFLSDPRDAFAMTMLKLGIDPDPEAVTEEDLQAVHDDIKPLVDEGLRFMGNEYIEAFQSGDIWAAMVWSGDMASSGGEDDVYVFPEEGHMIWTDNMLIPKGAANKRNAEAFIDYYYQPEVAAETAAYIYYVSPVEGVSEAIVEIDETAAENPLLFPTPELDAKAKSFQFFSPEIEERMNELYLDLSGA